MEDLTTKINLEQLIDKDRIIITELDQKQQVLDALIDKLASAPEIKSKQELKKRIFERESIMTTALGGGIAFPHVRLSSVTDLVMAIAICKSNINDYPSLDGEPVRIVVMIAASTNQQSLYLNVLSSISAKLKDRAIYEQILSAREIGTIGELIKGN